MDDLIVEFLTETNESLETVDNELVRLEQNPNDKAVLDNIFRLVHTIKGTCGFLGLPRLESVAHSAENVLGRFRDGQLTVTPALVSIILKALDRIKVILRGLESTGQEPAGDDSDLITVLDAAAAGEAIEAEAPTPAPAPEVNPVAETEKLLGRSLKPGEVTLEELEAAFAAASGPEATAATPEPVVAAAPAKAAAVATEAPAASDDAGASKAAGQSIRVSVDLLEDLMNLVSELVLTRNQLIQLVRRHDSSEFALPVQRLSQCTTELQEGVMKTRMQPIGNAWQKLPRIVRDLSVELHKKIDLDMKGAETELDRQVLELIKDPLTHMVRNSADHGIELPADRLMAGKPETGRVTLNAFHEGGHIVIEIADDGRGLNVARLKRKAIENGLVSEAEAAALSDQQVQKFIFHAGLSTAEKVTNVSGRGVGMDVVKSNIEKIGGTIDLVSEEGKGTRFAIKIPLTLAIVSALIVEAGAERFALPQIAVLELVRAAGDSEHKIEHVNTTPVLRLRNRLLPLVYLHQLLGLERAPKTVDEAFVVVTQVGAFTFGVVVDQVFDTEEIVVKPVAPILKSLPVYSGNTILGDGSVIMILDPNGLANATATLQSEAEQADAIEARSVGTQIERESMLVFRAGSDTPKAVPLSLVARLEDIPVEQVEFADGRPMVQYRGKLMPLVTVGPGASLVSAGRQAVLVFSDADKTMGLAVDAILDIVETELAIEMSSDVDGGIGTAVIADKVTEILDVGFYFRRAFRDHLQRKDGDRHGSAQQNQPKLLLIDDSTFFRNMLKPLLIASGYDVTVVADAQAALKLREAGATFDLIISDIEMPGLSGFDFAAEVRANGRWAETPLVALSSMTSPADLERGREVGFDDYVPKFDRTMLLNVLDEQLRSYKAAA
jgi:two-component system chemotaxis sensor kinase CheA